MEITEFFVILVLETFNLHFFKYSGASYSLRWVANRNNWLQHWYCEKNGGGGSSAIWQRCGTLSGGASSWDSVNYSDCVSQRPITQPWVRGIKRCRWVVQADHSWWRILLSFGELLSTNRLFVTERIAECGDVDWNTRWSPGVDVTAVTTPVTLLVWSDERCGAAQSWPQHQQRTVHRPSENRANRAGSDVWADLLWPSSAECEGWDSLIFCHLS